MAPQGRVDRIRRKKSCQHGGQTPQFHVYKDFVEASVKVLIPSGVLDCLFDSSTGVEIMSLQHVSCAEWNHDRDSCTKRTVHELEYET